MGLYVEFEVTNIDTMVVDLPNDYNLLEEIDYLKLPKNWQNKEEFTIIRFKKTI